MGRPILLLRLEGPLQSWGLRSRWDVRDTATEPTKSGIIGLLGCALGYPMYDPRLEALDAALLFGVRVEHPGVIVTDYQTITDFLPTAAGEWKGRSEKRSKSIANLRETAEPATIISPRAYLEDAAFLVALAAVADGEVLKQCAHAVEEPRWPLYLGRKACVPTRPIFDYFDSDYENIDHAFDQRPWEWLGAKHESRGPLPKNQLLAYIEAADGSLPRQDAVRINASRTYGFRTVRRAFFKPKARSDREEIKTEVS